MSADQNSAGKNWAGNYAYGAAQLHRPRSTAEVQEIVAKSQSVKALGSRHSFNDIADTAVDLVSTENLNRVLGIDSANRIVTIEAGITYGKLCPDLDAAGFAVPNLASLPHISVAGAVATATHGSGERNGNLASSVAGIQMVTADGSVVNLTKNDPEFNGAVVNLGALGIVTQLTLDLVPWFNVRQDLYQNLTLDQLEANFDAVQASAYSVSLFTDWRGSKIDQVWLKSQELDSPRADEFFGATRATRNLHPIGEISAENCTDQMGETGPWYERLAHFKMNFTPSSGEELQSEYFVPRQYATDALRAINGLSDEIAPLLLISEVRSIAADSLWMSPCYEQDCIAIHFTWQPRESEVRALLPRIEAILAPFQAKPHWGKLFAANPSSGYAMRPDFVRLAEKYDPTGKFRNAFLARTIFE